MGSLAASSSMLLSSKLNPSFISKDQPPLLSFSSSRVKAQPLKLKKYKIPIGGHHTQEDFAVRGKEPKDEVQMYTWKDATLRELTDLVKEVSPAVRRRDAKLSFAVVYPEKNGRMQVRKVGETFSNANKRQLDDNRALAEMNFQIGDSLDVSIE